MTAKESKPDMQEIIPVAGEMQLGGFTCTVKRLKTREFFSLLRVITGGLGPAIQNFNFSADQSESDMGAQAIAMATMAIPNALDEFVFFLRDIVEPVGEYDAKAFAEALDNPEIDETMEVIAMIVAQEAGDFRTLVGKAQAVFSKMPEALNKKTPAGK